MVPVHDRESAAADRRFGGAGPPASTYLPAGVASAGAGLAFGLAARVALELRPDDDRQRQDFVLRNTLSGGVTLNDCLLHLGQHGLPFGGVGASGDLVQLAHLALALIGGVGALYVTGLPSQFKLLQAKGARASVPLLLEVQRRPERRILESGNELFAVSGRIVNPTSDDLSVPDIRAELRDAQGKMVYGWTITPPRRTIEAKSVMEFNSAEVNVPRGAKELNLSF